MTAMSSRRNFTLNSLPTFQRPERRSWLSLSVQSWIRLSGSSPALQLGSQSRPGSSTALETRTFRSRQLNSWQSAPAQRRSWRSRERLTFSRFPIRKKQQSSLSKQLSRLSSRAFRARDFQCSVAVRSGRALQTLRNKYPRALGAGHDDVGEVDEAGNIVELEGNKGGTRRGQTGSRELRVSGKVWDVLNLHAVLSIPFDPEMTRLPGIIKPKREGTSGGRCRN